MMRMRNASETQDIVERRMEMFNKRLFEAHLVLAGVTKAELAKILGINVATLSRKLQREGDFTREEINKIMKVLKIDDPTEIFFAKENAQANIQTQAEVAE